MKYACPICKSNSDINFYFSNTDTRIIKEEYFLDPDRIDYYAETGVTGICPHCGYLIKDKIRAYISKSDIISFIKEKM